MALDLPFTFQFLPLGPLGGPGGVLTTYTGLKAAVGAWLARQGDTDIDARFDDFLALHETRMYYGRSPLPSLGLIACQPLRIREMETADPAFTLAATVAQPVGFLELIEAALNSPFGPLDIVTEGDITAYRTQTADRPRAIALSGSNFRVWPDPGTTNTATIRYFSRLATPTPENTNSLLATYPNLYLNGCLTEAAIYTGDPEAAKMYGSLYAADVQSLNERRNTELMFATNVRLRVRGRTP